MSQILVVFMLFTLTSCEILLSPPMVALEEEIAIEIIHEAKQEIEVLEK